MSSSKRGRKRNDNLPPNRARDVQRAFRARRAAHLQALEERVSELEEENNTLRAALSLPPANRLPLGKGPTGKDKPKPLPQSPSQMAPGSGPSTLPPISTLPMPQTGHIPGLSSRTDSPSSTSTRNTSLSPTSLNAALGQTSQSLPGLEAATWDDSMFMGKDQPEPSTSYTIPPVPGPSNSQSPSYASSASRQSMEDTYMPVQANYPYTSERPMGAADNYSGANSAFLLRDERRFTYPQPSFPTHAGQLQSHSSPVSAMSPTVPPQSGNVSIQNTMPYAHRRSITESQGYRPTLGQIPPLQQMRLPHPHALTNRLSSPSQLAGSGVLPPPQGYEVSGDRRLDRMR